MWSDSLEDEMPISKNLLFFDTITTVRNKIVNDMLLFSNCSNKEEEIKTCMFYFDSINHIQKYYNANKFLFNRFMVICEDMIEDPNCSSVDEIVHIISQLEKKSRKSLNIIFGILKGIKEEGYTRKKNKNLVYFINKMIKDNPLTPLFELEKPDTIDELKACVKQVFTMHINEILYWLIPSFVNKYFLQ